MIRIAAPMLLLVVSLAACNTAAGLGEDVQAGGQAITGAANTTEEKLEDI